MNQLNDCIVTSQGGGQINDVLAKYYGMTAHESLNDAEYRWLIAQGAVPAQINDMWYEFLSGKGYVGALNDMLYMFWCVGGGSVGPAPPVIHAPSTITGTEGLSTTLAPVILNAVSYVWKKNGVVIAGETGKTLTLVNLSSTNEGTYTVVATNTHGSTTSSGMVLTIVPPVATSRAYGSGFGAGFN